MTGEQQNLLIPTYKVWAHQARRGMFYRRQLYKKDVENKKRELFYAKKEYLERRKSILGSMPQRPKLNIDPMRYGIFVKENVNFASEKRMNIKIIKRKKDLLVGLGTKWI